MIDDRTRRIGKKKLRAACHRAATRYERDQRGARLFYPSYKHLTIKVGKLSLQQKLAGIPRKRILILIHFVAREMDPGHLETFKGLFICQILYF